MRAYHNVIRYSSKPGRTAKHIAALLRKLTTDKKSVVRQTIANFIVCTNESDVAEPAVSACSLDAKADKVQVPPPERAPVH